MSLIFKLDINLPPHGSISYLCAEYDVVTMARNVLISPSFRKMSFAEMQTQLEFDEYYAATPRFILEIFSEQFYNVHIKDAFINIPFPKQFSKSVKYYGEHAMFILLNL